MKTTLSVLLITLLLALGVVPNIQAATNPHASVVEGLIIIKLRQGVILSSNRPPTGLPSLDQKLAEFQAQALEPVFPYLRHSAQDEASRLAKVYYVHYTLEVTPTAVASAFSQDPNIEYAEPKYVAEVTELPDDPDYGMMTQFLHVHAPEAWDVVKGEAGDVVIAIVDNGTDWRHEDLFDNVWTNPGEIPDNEVDDDGNGFVDDVHGWNFPYNNNDPTPFPGNSHGTHTAGTAAAVTNNTIGVASISWNCRYMPLNTAAPGVSGSIQYGYEGIAYAAANGADLISNSWGGQSPHSQFAQDVINYAHSNGSLVIAAAGNESSNNDVIPFYPSSYEHVLSVGATDRDTDQLASFSDYGVTVDLYAPGVGIWSTMPGDGYGTKSGTSMATPMVAGLAGLVKTLHPSWSQEQVREQIRVTCDGIEFENPGLEGLLGKGRINAHRAVTETGSPSIRIVGTSFEESGGDGTIDRADTVDVTVQFRNYLAATTDISVTVAEHDSLVTLLDDTGFIAGLETDEVADVAFRFVVDPTAPDGHVLPFITNIDDGSYADRDFFALTVNPLRVVTHSTSLVEASVTNEGNVGWTEFAGSEGVGFRYMGADRLYEGGLLIATSAERVSDCIRGANPGMQDNDFRPTSDLVLESPGPIFDQESFVGLDDSLAANPIGLRVQQWVATGIPETPGADGLMALIYDVGNPTDATMADLHIGLFYDWNVNVNAMDWSRFDPSRKMGYVMDAVESPSKLLAVKILTRSHGWSYRSIDNVAEIDDGFTGEEKWSFLSGGIQTTSLDGTDLSTLISVGPLTLHAFEQMTVGFVVIAASSLPELGVLADMAQAQWDIFRPTGIDPTDNMAANRLFLGQNYPNPFSPTTTIELMLPHRSGVTLKVHDVLGRVVETLVAETLPAGSYLYEWNAVGLPGGVYWYQLRTEDGATVSRKLVLLK